MRPGAACARRAGTLGETLDGLPGISATSYGPNVSRPIIRGLDGDRIRVLQNGTASLDASSLSYDHAVAQDPLSIERVEIVRGPAALLYGGNAVGGVVNTIDNRIPRESLTGISGATDFSYGGANRERAGAAQLEFGNGQFAFHVDGFARKSADLRIPGLRLTVVAADGQDIEPVTVDEFRIGPAETCDVIVAPSDDRAYTIFAQAMDRSGYARGTLAPRNGMTAEIPPLDPRPLLTMQDMMGDMGHGTMGGAARSTMKGMDCLGSTLSEACSAFRAPTGSPFFSRIAPTSRWLTKSLGSSSETLRSAASAAVKSPEASRASASER